MLPEIKLASFWVSAIAAIGIPQLTTGPQKCYSWNVINEYVLIYVYI
jgi:hypothetical protein